MAKTVTFFHTSTELLQLTGLKTRADLWSVGFDLDDWDFGFVSDTPWHEDLQLAYQWWLLDKLSDYHVGYQHTEYNGKHYYIAYHS